MVSGKQFSPKEQIPEPILLKDDALNDSFLFKPLFDLEESFPNLFENLPYPKDASDILFSEPGIKRINTQANRVKSMYSSNKRLLKRIESCLKLLQVVNFQTCADHNIQDSHYENRDLQREDKVRLDLLNVETRPKQMTDGELIWMLENEKNALLPLLKDWLVTLNDHKLIIEHMERYKKLVYKYTKRYYRKENPLENLINLLVKTNNNTAEETKLSEGINNIKKSYIRAKIKEIWAHVNSYFIYFDPNLKSALEKLLIINESKEPEIEFLNMGVINRLCAIAKMYQYCHDNFINEKEFMDGRTYQKIKARLNQLDKYKMESHIDTNKEIMYLPSLDEIPFLLSIGYDNLNRYILILKTAIMSCTERNYITKYDEQLEIITKSNRSLIRRILEKARTDKEPQPIPEAPRITCCGKRTHAKSKKVDDKKRPKTDDSGTDTNATPKEPSVKITVTLSQKMESSTFNVFKINHTPERYKSPSWNG